MLIHIDYVVLHTLLICLLNHSSLERMRRYYSSAITNFKFNYTYLHINRALRAILKELMECKMKINYCVFGVKEGQLENCIISQRILHEVLGDERLSKTCKIII